MKRHLLYTFLGLLFSTAHAQDLASSRKTSFYTYIFKITEGEARKIYQKDLSVVTDTFFHTVVDSFPTARSHHKQLPVGNYLTAFASGNELEYELQSFGYLQVKLLNNKTDLAVHLHDSLGNSIANASVFLKGKPVRFDVHTQSYRLKKTNRQGLLAVEYKGFTSYHALTSQYKSRRLMTGVKRIVFGKPGLGYLSMPFYRIYSSIRDKYPQGWIRAITRPFHGSWWEENFNRDRISERRNGKFMRKHRGFIIFNKPRYQPKDTVKFKAVVFNRKGKSVSGNAGIHLKSYEVRKEIKLAQLTAYRTGTYEYAFFLHDSLKLRLGTQCQIVLKNKKGQAYLQDDFTYEDYELKSNTFAIRTDRKDYYRGNLPVLYAKGTDENDLNVPDARVRLTVLPHHVLDFTDRQVVVPDTLWQCEQKLDALGETKITLPDTIFPNAELGITVQAVFLNSSNEQRTRTLQFTTHYQPDELRLTLQRDSVVAEYFQAGKPNSAEAELLGYADEENDVESFQKKVRLPYREAVSPYVNYYEISMPGLSAELDLSEQKPNFQVATDRTADSIFVQVSNPRRLPFWYDVHRKNSRLASGFCRENLDIQRKSTVTQKYFISLQYVWNNKVHEEDYELPLATKQLQIQTDQPTTVSPGQTVPIRVEVRDFRNQPVANADVTAYGITKKFSELRTPSVPDFSKTYRVRKQINSFALRDKFDVDEGENESKRQLQWQRWRKEMGLDTIAYFQFLYPNGVYQYSLPMPNLMTQLAPFVVQDGEIQTIHTIFVDEEPIYFQVADEGQRYSFHTDSGYHRLHIRTRTLGIRMDSVYLKKGEKLILSIDPKTAGGKHIRVETLEPKLSAGELQVVNNYLMPVRRDFGNSYTYLKQGKRVFYLNGGYGYRAPTLIGPVKPSEMRFVQKDAFETEFTFEPGFGYDFAPNLLKMRTWQGYRQFPLTDVSQNKTPDFRAKAWTAYEVDSLHRGYREIPAYSREEYNNPYATSSPNGKITARKLKCGKQSVQNVKYLVLFKQHDPGFIRVYPAKTLDFHQLPAGTYNLVMLLHFNEYLKTEPITVRKNATTYLNLQFDATQKADEFSRKLEALVKEKITVRIADTKPIEEKAGKEKVGVNPTPPPPAPVRKPVPPELLWHDFDFNSHVQGRVFDDNGDAVPGVNVLVKGSTKGTVTNVDGIYSFDVPDKAMLVFSFIGYVSVEREISGQSVLDVQMQPDIKSLQEVVVVGYGTSRKRDLTGSVSTVLQGRVAGVVISKSGERINIRGMGSLRADQRPLFIVDGKVYEGEQLDPEVIASAEMLKGEAARALYGNRAANGVVVITTKKNSMFPKAKTSTAQELPNQAPDSQIRSKFSDYAFWQPRLKTDKNGQATFHATFPDDITNWRTFAVAVGSRQRTGLTEGNIKSFKTLAGSLAVPRFLVQGDSTQIIGKALNYTSDTVDLRTTFEVNGKILSRNAQKVYNALIDSAMVTTDNLDSLKIKYFIQKTDGYADGELRPVPVFARGVTETKGVFLNLEKDTTVQLTFDPKLGKVKLYARADVLDILLDEIGHLRNYEYLCNEQTASKLKAYLLEKRIQTHLNKPFAYDADIIKLVRKLEKAQKKEGAWGWWQDSPVAAWVSVHVAEALLQAAEAKYATTFDRQKFIDYFVFQVEQEKGIDERLRMLKILQKLNAKVDFKRHIQQLDTIFTVKKPIVMRNELGYVKTVRPLQRPFMDYLHLLELKQQVGFGFSMDTISATRQSTLFGSSYWGEESHHPYLNEVQTTLAVYRILKANGGHERELTKIRNYFFEQRKTGYWRNTYESAQILETILSDVLGNAKTIRAATLTLKTNGESQLIKQFPFEMEADQNSILEIGKTGTLPVYLTAYQKFQNTNPAAVDKDFLVKTSFKGQNATQKRLKAGETVTLHVDLAVKKDADYMLIEVPIPAGCSYAEASAKSPLRSSYETYREPFRHKTAIYCTQLTKGNYSFDIQLVSRYVGTYTLNPAKAELMYFPTFFGRNEMRKVTVK